VEPKRDVHNTRVGYLTPDQPPPSPQRGSADPGRLRM